ncbi:MAG: saccharopine dehydrogenase NADP-binding domain-containing protein [Chloroflexota bacterium]|nr:MAG: saccharopine dehydrogenase NADP-binding domain-containing protein [Chloroflexota bacterium]
MKVLVIGSGKVGAASAWDLVRDNEVEMVGIVDKQRGNLERLQKRINSSKLKLHILDVSNTADMKILMNEYDVGIISLPARKISYMTVEAAIEVGLDVVDILEDYHRRPDPYETEGLNIPDQMTLEEYGEYLHKRATENDVIVVDGLGFAPGLSNITVGEAIRKMDTAESAIARVGGIPTKEVSAKYPLKYMITWAFQHVLRQYMVQVEVIKNGKIVEVSALSDREKFRFTKFGKNEELECAVTSGMPSYIHTRPQLNEFAEKTIRWPGHFESIDTLKEFGMLDLTPVEFRGMKIAPRDFLLSIIEPKLKAVEGDADVCVMWNTVTGTNNGHKMKIDYYMWEEADTKSGISAMGRVTGFPAAVGAKLIGKGAIEKKGIVPPEDAIEGKVYQNFMEELASKNITVLEGTETS